MMSRTKRYLLLIASFTLMFIGLVALGGHFWAAAQKGLALALFLLAFASVFGQMASLALYLRQRAQTQWRQQQPQRPPQD